MAPKDLLVRIPLVYRLFFLIVEPISALVGAYYAFFLPATYLSLTAHTPLQTRALSVTVQTTVEVVLAQLANLYFLFAVNEAVVLRAALTTSDTLDVRGLKVWNAVLLGLLIADFGHLYSVRALGGSIYWQASSWNAMDAGNVGFVYAGATMRISWLLGLGLRGQAGRE